ncbi:signal transduction histidine kinase [Lactobacillus selangorensis]|uniref:histidine kinase n=1 Tax=Lactobacillus selangorensis TaxID=81857 RepID=A0A0R2FHM0_9LACO|nr:HAMP domain-containing sensor histidine kinase [Lactobacillus selangorensis]KRN28088.1 signal transduction histidine kinase [Lactobacillus selangorensis]KRN31034.1 signal transduction histidine kinase [Lactobacillus selangorensis]
MRTAQKQDSASIMLRSFLLLIIIIIFFSSLTTVVAVGHQLLEVSRSNSAEIITSLKKTVIDGDGDWKNWRSNSTLNTSTSYVHVVNNRPDADTKNYYSPGTYSLLKIRPQKVFFFSHLYYRNGKGFFYYKMGHAKGIQYQLWTSLNQQAEILERVILVTIVILVLTLLISPLYIRVIADRLTDPLKKLTTSAKKAAVKPSQDRVQLPVPVQPNEVNELANSFNQLLTRLNKQAEQEKLFVSNAAHELRTPIATIRSHAQLIERRGKAHPEIIPKSVHYINDESQQMQTLVEELLTLSRADRMQLDFTEFDVSALLVKIVGQLQPLIPQTIQATLPEKVTVTAHQASIEQIVLNLLNNASKYSPADSQIQLILSEDNSHPVLQVVDQGRGITDQEKQHIFERFYRSDEIRGSIPGTGLGLAIVKQLSDLNHLQLTVRDNQPAGTIFTLTF